MKEMKQIYMDTNLTAYIKPADSSCGCGYKKIKHTTSGVTTEQVMCLSHANKLRATYKKD